MKIIEKTFDHSGLTVEFVEFEPVNRDQVSVVDRDIKRHLAAINAREATPPAKAAAAYKENAA